MEIISQNDDKLKRQIKNFNLNATFNDSKIYSVATFTYVELFKQIIDLKELINNGVACKKCSNAIFSVAEIIEYLIDANILGFSRFMHTEDLRNDIGYKKQAIFFY
jgi:hypothetical protein